MTRRVLLVEDNPSDAKLALLAFKHAGVPNEIVVERDGADALDYLFGNGKHAGRDLSDAPAIVLLDLKLPRVDGLEVLRRIRADERTQLLRVIVMTASKEEEDLIRSYSLGTNAYVRKPVDFVEFVETAKTLAHFWLELNHPPPPRIGS